MAEKVARVFQANRVAFKCKTTFRHLTRNHYLELLTNLAVLKNTASLLVFVWISLAVWFVLSRLRENNPQYGPGVRLVARKYHTNKSLRLIRLQS